MLPPLASLLPRNMRNTKKEVNNAVESKNVSLRDLRIAVHRLLWKDVLDHMQQGAWIDAKPYKQASERCEHKSSQR
jgi:hypothetical protein